MSLYRFKSRETGDLVMLASTGERVLEILGKDPSGPGILLPEHMADAVQRLRDAVAQDEAQRQRRKDEAEADAEGEQPPEAETVSLRLRCAPLIEMLQRCEKAKVEMVWGV